MTDYPHTHHHSPHFEERKNGIRPEYIVIHCTETATAEEAHNHYIGKVEDENAGRISPHYMIDEKGHVHQYVDEDKRAWHAGLSYWDGIDDMNSASVGIELSNLGKAGNFPPYTLKQMWSLAELCKGIISRHNINHHNVLAHSDISVGRRTDPDKHFEWKSFAEMGVGVWPGELNAQDRAVAKVLVDEPERFRLALVSYGYKENLEFPDMIEAFHRHFFSEVFDLNDEMATRTIQVEGARRLACLLRMKKGGNT